MRSDFQFMKELSDYTHIAPSDRWNKLSKFADDLEKFERKRESICFLDEIFLSFGETRKSKKNWRNGTSSWTTDSSNSTADFSNPNRFFTPIGRSGIDTTKPIGVATVRIFARWKSTKVLRCFSARRTKSSSHRQSRLEPLVRFLSVEFARNWRRFSQRFLSNRRSVRNENKSAEYVRKKSWENRNDFDVFLFENSIGERSTRNLSDGSTGKTRS